MQKKHISKKTYFISLIALVFVLGLSGCDKPLSEEDVAVDEGTAGDVVVEGGDALGGEGDDSGSGLVEADEFEVGGETADEGEVMQVHNLIPAGTFHVFIEIDEIQKFLDTQNGILKNSQIDDYGQMKSAAELIELASTIALTAEEVNEQIILVLLEVKANAITNLNLKVENLINIMGITQEEYEAFYISRGYPEEKISELNANSFRAQLTYIVEKIGKYYWQAKNQKKDQPSSPLIVNFKSGRTYKLKSDIEPESLAIYQILADLVESEDQWEYWISKEQGSFYYLYHKWFVES